MSMTTAMVTTSLGTSISSLSFWRPSPRHGGRKPTSGRVYAQWGGGTKTLIQKTIYVQQPSMGRPRTSQLQVDEAQPVFVAGATGQAGVRVVLALLSQGFVVRAGVPDVPSTEKLVRLVSDYGVITPAEASRLAMVELSYGDPEAIARSIERGAKVVVTVGSGEKGPAHEVTVDDALSVVQAAAKAGASHVLVVYGEETGNIDFLMKVAETGVSYTVLRAALVDDDDSNQGLHGLVGITTTLPTKVPKSQIAEHVLDVFSSMSVTENKVAEVSAGL